MHSRIHWSRSPSWLTHSYRRLLFLIICACASMLNNDLESMSHVSLMSPYFCRLLIEGSTCYREMYMGGWTQHPSRSCFSHVHFMFLVYCFSSFQFILVTKSVRFCIVHILWLPVCHRRFFFFFTSQAKDRSRGTDMSIERSERSYSDGQPEGRVVSLDTKWVGRFNRAGVKPGDL